MTKLRVWKMAFAVLVTKLSGWKAACTVFLLCAATAIASPGQTFTTLYTFCSQPNCTDGAVPYARLVQATDGNLYGTAETGGGNSGGTIFQITPQGALTTLYSFCQDFFCSDGFDPNGLVQSTNGDLYGTTVSGGGGAGTVFRTTLKGALTTLHSFNFTDGSEPRAGLVQATNGNFYGTTYEDGAHFTGSVFQITPKGALTTLHSFCSQPNCTDGSNPYAGLVQATNGNLYGTTPDGGANAYGTVFQITPKGMLTTLYSFCSQPNCPDGSNPYAGLVQATNGNLYGTTRGGGANNGANSGGTVFQITPRGTLTTLYSFCLQLNCTDGTYPYAGLVQATDGNFYGTTPGGGANGYGTVFQITPKGTLTTLYSFCSQPNCTDGSYPQAGLVQATNGDLYGTTDNGGEDCIFDFNGCGTIFSLDVGLGPFVTFIQAAGKVGQTGGILGQGFTGTTSVSLNATPATFKVVSDTYIRATVPKGSTTGYVTVTTPSGTLTSNVQFHVIP